MDSFRLLWEQNLETISEMVRLARRTRTSQSMWLQVDDGSVFLAASITRSDDHPIQVIDWVGPWDSRGTLALCGRDFTTLLEVEGDYGVGVGVASGTAAAGATLVTGIVPTQGSQNASRNA